MYNAELRHPRGLFPTALAIAGGLGVLYAEFSTELTGTLIIFSAYTLALIVCYGRGNFGHPVSTFALFFFPYSTWFALHCLIGGLIFDHAALVESLRLSLFGLWCFHLTSLVAINCRRSAPRLQPNSAFLRFGVPLIVAFSGLVVLAASIEAIHSGAASKRDILNIDSILGSAAGFAAIILTAGVMLKASELAGKSNNVFGILKSWWLIYGLAVQLAGLLILGERDYLFRFGFCLLVILLAAKHVGGLALHLGLLACIILVLPISQLAKSLTLSSSGLQIRQPSTERLLAGEFTSASRNLYMLKYHGVDHDWSSLWSDSVRGLVPFSGRLGFQSSTSWFNRVYRVEHEFSGTSGWGFSIIATGWRAGGYAGVAVVMALVSALICVIFSYSGQSAYWRVFYLLALASVIYCIRADLANVLSQVFKVGGSSVLLLRYASRLKFGRSRDIPYEGGAQA